MIVVSYLTPEPDYEKIKDVIYDSENKEVGSNKDKLLTFLLIAAVLVIWYVFR